MLPQQKQAWLQAIAKAKSERYAFAIVVIYKPTKSLQIHYFFKQECAQQFYDTAKQMKQHWGKVQQPAKIDEVAKQFS